MRRCIYVADKLQAALELREMSQRQLALRAGVATSHISRMVRGEAVPTVDVAARIAEALDVSLDWLCGLPERQAGALPPDEDELLALYRAMSEVGRGLTLDMARVVAERARETALRLLLR